MLNCISPHLTENLSGCSVGTDFLANLQRRYPLALTSAPGSCRIVCCAADRSAELADNCAKTSSSSLAAIDSYCGKSQYILNCFNVLDNAICIFDSSASLLYANKRYLDIMRVQDPHSVVGMKIQDIAKQSGIKNPVDKNGSTKTP